MQQIKVQPLAFTAVDGHALAGYRFDPEQAPRAVVVIAPAMAIYQKFYAEFARWLSGCLTPDYILSGEPGAREAYASARYPVLALTFSDDELLLESGSQLIHGAYTPGRVDYRPVRPQDFGDQRIGHVGFFRPLGQEQLWPLVRDWLYRAIFFQ